MMGSDHPSPKSSAPSAVLFRAWVAFCRNWPFIRGRDRIMRLSISSPRIKKFLQGQPEWMQTREGFRMQVNRELDYTSFMLRLFGNLEPKTGKFILDNMNDSEAFLDIGANVGYFGLLVADRFPNSRVISFEPNPPIEHCLSASVVRNAFDDRMKIVRSAVSNQAGTLSFTVETVNSGHSRIATDSTNGEVIRVNAVVLDHWIKENPPGCRIACVKMDVEGAEVLALKGMVAILERHQPALCIEGYDDQLREFGTSLVELRKLLTDAGYREVAEFDGNLYMKHQSRITNRNVS